MRKLKKLCCIFLALLLCTLTLGNFPVVSYAAKGDIGEGFNVDNLNVEFTTVDGEKISSGSKGVVTVLLFARTNGMCLNSSNAIKSVCSSNWIHNESIRFVVVDIDGVSAETVRAMKDKNGNDEALFCYDETIAAKSTMFNYLRNTVGAVSSVTLPVMVVIDGNNKVQYCTTGSTNANTIYSYVEDLVGMDFPDEPKGNVDVYVEGTFDEEEAFKVLELVNKARAEQGKNPLKMDEVLTQKAMHRAAECLVYYDHTRPDGEPWVSILESPYNMGCAENIAAGHSNADDVVTGWLNSPGHYANIMNENYESIGIGCFYQDGVRYWTQLFSVYSGAEKNKEANSEKKVAVKADSNNLGSMSLKYESQNLELGKVAKPTLKINNPGFGSFVPSKDNIVFQTSNETVAKVDADGTLHACSGGEAVITAVLGDAVKAEFKISVEEPQGMNHILRTIDGEEILIEPDGTKEATILIFGDTSFNTVGELSSISNSSWISNSKIQVIFIDIGQSDLEIIKKFAELYGCDEMKFCYDTGTNNIQVYEEYLSHTNFNKDNIRLPLTVLLDKNNRIYNSLQGYYSEDVLLSEINGFAILDDTLNTIDGETISTSADGSKEVTMLIFGQTTCGNTFNELKSISESEWISNSKIRVIFAEISNANLETTKNFASNFNTKNISFCYDEGARNTQLFNQYLNVAGINVGGTPITILIDKNNKVQKILSGRKSADELLNEMKWFAVLEDGDDNTGNDKPGDDNTGNDKPGDDNTGGDKPGNDNTGGDTPGGDDSTGDAVFLAGDADCNKTVNLDDAKIVLRLAVGIKLNNPVTEQGQKNADYDKSGKIDLKDATYTLKAAAGIKFTLPKD